MTTSLVLLATAGSARAVAPDEFTFTGRGYGHAVGMSQWGAWAMGRAPENYGAGDILTFYYPGTGLKTLDPANPLIKVKLSSEPAGNVSSLVQKFGRVDVTAGQTGFILAVKSGSTEVTETIGAGGSISIAPTVAGGVSVTSPAKAYTGDEVVIRTGTGGDGTGGIFESTFHAGGRQYGPRRYRGKLQVKPVSGQLEAYNLLHLEDYLKGIAEVPASWANPAGSSYSPGAVRAQAVAARTYAVRALQEKGILEDNQNDQVYRGYDSEDPYMTEAVKDTANRVLRAAGGAGELVATFYSSNSGGYTRDNVAAWGGLSDSGTRLPYLTAKPDPWSLEAPPDKPGYAWSYTVSQDELSTKVGEKFGDLGTVVHVSVASRDTSDPDSHARALKLEGTRGTLVIDADDFRALFGYSLIRSTLITRIDNPGFKDVPPTHPYYAEITQVAGAGLVSGYPDDTFKPDQSASRWQFAKMAVGLHNALSPDAPIEVVDAVTPPFSDVPIQTGVTGDESDWVAAAKEAGLVRGLEDGRFAPHAYIRRDQVATMLVRALDWEEPAAALSAETPSFADVPPQSVHWAAATYLKTKGILNGYEEPAGSGRYELRPGEEISRRHIAALLARVLGGT